MLLGHRCYPCILGDLSGALELLEVEKSIAQRVMMEATEFMAKEGPQRKVPSYYITAAHRMLKRATGIEEPFHRLRKRTNEICVEILDRLRDDIGKTPSAKRFQQTVLWCVAANHIDFRTAGTGYGFDPETIYSFLEEEVQRGLAVDMVEEFRTVALDAEKILYIHDNVGEVAIDTLLIEELRRMGAEVTSALRGGAITSDATIEDGRVAGVFDVSDNVILAGPDTLGISIEEMTDDLAFALEEADLIISKGQANYYVLTEYSKKNTARIAYVFGTKCDPVSEQFNLKGKQNIVWIK